MSERLTKRKDDGCACWNGDQNLVTHRRYSEMLEALAKYEDVIFDADGNEVISLDRLRELASAEREGRLVVLPCKTGDIIFVDALGFMGMPLPHMPMTVMRIVAELYGDWGDCKQTQYMSLEELAKAERAPIAR